jgi:hypothetical protein
MGTWLLKRKSDHILKEPKLALPDLVVLANWQQASGTCCVRSQISAKSVQRYLGLHLDMGVHSHKRLETMIVALSLGVTHT